MESQHRRLDLRMMVVGALPGRVCISCRIYLREILLSIQMNRHPSVLNLSLTQGSVCIALHDTIRASRSPLHA